MTITTEISKLQENLANAYSSIEEKGATLPTNQNFDNLATAISSIPSGGGSEKYETNIDTLLGDVDTNGVLQTPTEQSDLVFTGVKDVVAYGLYYKFVYSKVKSVSFPDLTTVSGYLGCNSMFQYCLNLTSTSLPNLTTVSGSNGCDSMFRNCSLLTSVSFPNLTTVSGSNGCNHILQNCLALTSVSLPNLTTISGGSGCGYMLYNCPNLTSVSFPALTTISGSNGCTCMLGYCTALTDAYFPALTTISFGSYVNQFNNMMISTGKTTTHTLHFPSNLESTISSLTGYPLFGGTSGYVVCAFDLDPTE